MRRMIHYAARRWADSVLAVIDSETDPRTLQMWARCAGASVGALRARCRAAGVATRDSLYFARILRAVVLAHATAYWEPMNLLDIADSRTLRRVFIRSRLRESGPPPALETFIAMQGFVTSPHNLAEIRDLLRQRSESTAHAAKVQGAGA